MPSILVKRLSSDYVTSVCDFLPLLTFSGFNSSDTPPGMAQTGPAPEHANSSRKPLHIHVGSLATQASAVADSTLTSGTIGTVVSVSQFPSPPPLPTPTASALTGSTPTTSRFADRLTPTIPNYDSPSHFSFGTPPTPRSPADSSFSINIKRSDWRNKDTSRTQGTDGGYASSSYSQETTRNVPTRNVSQTSSGSQYPPRPLPHRSENSDTSTQQPPSSMRRYEKRPASPQSNIAPSTITDWSDGASGISGISVNPSEERLLTTSFITSLLSSSPEPFPGERLSNARRKLVRQLDKSNNGEPPQKSGYQSSAKSHQSVPFYPSDVLAADVPTTAYLPPSISGDHESDMQHDSAVGHSDDSQIQIVSRKPSISYVLGGAEKKPVGVVPAYRVSIGPSGSDGTGSSYRTSINSGLTSSTLASKPPGHRADAPQSVSHANAFEAENNIRESDEEEVVKLGGGGDIVYEKLEAPMSPAIPSTAGSKKTFFGLDARPGSGFTGHTSNRSGQNDSAYGSNSQSLRRSQSRKSMVSSLVSRISHGSTAAKDRYMAWLRSRPLPPLPPMANNPAPEFPNGREIQKSEETIPLPMLARRAENLQGYLNRGRYPTSSGYNSQYEYKEASPDEEGDAYAGRHRHTYSEIQATGTSNGSYLAVLSRFRKNKETSNYGDASSPTSPKLVTLEQKKKRRRLWTLVACVIVGIILVIAIPVGISKSRKDSLPDCPGNETGEACTLDATCVCTSDTETCKPLANSLNLLVPDMNFIFKSNFTSSQISDAVVSAVGSSSNGLCAKQAMLIDVEPALDSASSPNRTKWAQSAILWNLGMSQDIEATTTLQKFVSSADWGSAQTRDGKASDDSGKFGVVASGYTFNFAQQTVIPDSASFKSSAPSSDQLGELTDDMVSVLDRMYSFAIGMDSHSLSSLLCDSSL